MVRFYGFREGFEAISNRLKQTACPHCKRVGTLIRYGFLYGYDEDHPRKRTVRAQRIFCNNRKRAKGCGRTFSVWAADKIRRLFLTAGGLWTFLKRASASGNKAQALRDLHSGLADSASSRIWKRFREAQSAIRTTLGRLCPAPRVATGEPTDQTIAHLEAAFPDSQCPIADFQVTSQTFFL